MKTKWKIYIAIWALVVLLNVVAWNSKEFCDWYIFHIFPLWVNTYGRITGLFPFSVGEILIVAGVLLVVSLIIIGLLHVALKVKEAALVRKMKKPAMDSDLAVRYGMFFGNIKGKIHVFYH